MQALLQISRACSSLTAVKVPGRRSAQPGAYGEDLMNVYVREPVLVPVEDLATLIAPLRGTHAPTTSAVGHYRRPLAVRVGAFVAVAALQVALFASLAVNHISAQREPQPMMVTAVPLEPTAPPPPLQMKAVPLPAPSVVVPT